MVRQYRIDRFNGMEILVCECYRKHTWTQEENDQYFAWKEAQPQADESDLSREVFRIVLDEQLGREGVDQYFGLRYPIPVFDTFPSVVLRGVIVDNRIASLQVDYPASTLPPEIFVEIRRFYDVMDSRHWRDTVAHQLEKYGTLFGTDND